MPALRVLVLHLTPFPSSRAPAIQVANMAQAFSALGHDTLLVSPTPGPAHTTDLEGLLGFAPGFRAATLSPRTRRGQSFRHAVRIARLARRERADLILSRDLRGCLIPAVRGVPTLFEAHALTPLQRPFDRWALRRLVRARGFRGVVAISGALADDLIATCGLARDDVIVLHDGVRTGAVAAPEATDDVRPDGQPFRVAYTGSLYPGKGADLLIDVARRCPSAAFTIAGGPDARADALRARALAEGLTNVEVTGLLDPAAAAALQRSSDALIAPFSARVESDSGVDISRWTSPLKVFEYLASGRPSIVGDLPVLREVLRPDVDALIVPLDDVEAFASAIRRLADDPALARRVAGNARERVLAAYTWEARARAVVRRATVGHPGPAVRRVSILLASFASGGAERVAITLAEGLARTGRQVRLVVADGRGPLRAQLRPGVDVVDLRAPRVRRALVGMVRDLRRHRPDLVVMTQTHLSLAVLGALRLLPARPERQRLVVREPLLRTGGHASDRQERWQRRLFPTADLLVASSRAMADRLRTVVGGAVPTVELANPVDVARLREAAARGGPVAGRTEDATVRLISVGRLVPQKAHADLLHALAGSARKDLRLTVVGDGPLRAELAALADTLGVADRIRFAGHVDDRDALLAEVAAADLLVQPSSVEGMPNAVLEALAVGTPVLATTDLVVLSELAAEVGEDALRLVPRDELGAALATVRAATDPTPRPSLLPERFVVDTVVAALLEAVEHVGADAGA